jgi:hypothetical protein
VYEILQKGLLRLSHAYLWVLVFMTMGSGSASALTIYRFGGTDLPPPPEAGQAGVDFVPLRWSDLEPQSGGQTRDLEMGDVIQPRQHDGNVNLAPESSITAESGIDFGRSALALDGDPRTTWILDGFECEGYTDLVRHILCTDEGFSKRGIVAIDLGGQFLVERIRVLSGLNDAFRVAEEFRVTMAPGGGIVYVDPYAATDGNTFRIQLGSRPVDIDVRGNTQPVREIIIPPEHQRAAAVILTMGKHVLPWEIAEIEIYARGVVDSARYVSNILDMGGPAAWGDVRWSGHAQTGATVLLQTRSGVDDDPTLYWRYTGRSDEKVQVSLSEYALLRVGERAGTSYDARGWTFWSEYDFEDSTGTPVISLSPRRFLQFQIDFLSDGEVGGRLDFIELRASRPPPASRLIAEVFPALVNVGQSTWFTYAVRPAIVGDDTGFDTLELTTPAIISAVRSVRQGDVDVPFSVEELAEHRLVVSFPRLDARNSGTIVEVELEARVFRTKSQFRGRVSDSDRPLEVSQSVVDGDATGELESSTTSVLTSIRARPVVSVSVRHRILTPNGDGVNDGIDIVYDLFELTGSVPVTILVRDLAGRPVRRLLDRLEPLGNHSVHWDGRDDNGALVSPGIYLYSLRARTGTGSVERIGSVHVVY